MGRRRNHGEGGLMTAAYIDPDETAALVAEFHARNAQQISDAEARARFRIEAEQEAPGVARGG